MYRYEDFEEKKLISSFQNEGFVQLCLGHNESKVFDYVISRYSNAALMDTKTSEGAMLFLGFFANLHTVYRLWFRYRKLSCFDNVFNSEQPIEFKKRTENGEVIYMCKKILKDSSSV